MRSARIAKLFLAASILAMALVAAATSPALLTAATGFRLRSPLTRDADNRPIAKPEVRGISDLYNITYNTWMRHLSFENIFERERPALNVNAWDEAPDSSWFTNRMGLRSLSFDEIVSSLEGAPPSRPQWYVRRRNDSGYTPKVDIVDNNGAQNGRQFVLKFDPKGARERNSGAERIGTLILHAAGYNVPHNSIVYFTVNDLRFDKDSKYRDPFNKDQDLTADHVRSMLDGVDPMPDGRYRGIASLRLSGDALDPFRFTGRRKDDSNDYILHELRRELRGMGVISSWINHVDIKDNQALDMFIPGQDGRGHVKHHLLDFSATLGAYEWPADPLRIGHEYMFDSSAMGKSFFSLGLWERPWSRPPTPYYSEVGYFSADLFDPPKWKPSFPNIAFEHMDDSDGYWGAKIVTAFTNDTIRRLALAGEYQRSEVTRYVEATLKARRDAIGWYWLNRVTPLEALVLAGGRLRFRDLGVERGYDPVGPRVYRSWIEDLNGKRLSQPRESKLAELEIPGLDEAAQKAPAQPADKFGRTPLVRVLVQTGQPNGEWALPVEVFIGRQAGRADLQVLGWTHAPRKR